MSDLFRVVRRNDALLGQHVGMGLGRRDVLAVKSLVEIDGGVDLLHDGVGTGGKPPAPHFVAHDRTEELPLDMTETQQTPARHEGQPPRLDCSGLRRRRAGRVRRGIRVFDLRAQCGRPRLPSGGGIGQENSTFGAWRSCRGQGCRGAAAAAESCLHRRQPARRLRWPISAAARCCSTSGPPGACLAARKCRRSMRLKPSSAARLRGGGGQHRHPRSGQAEAVSQRDRRAKARLFCRPDAPRSFRT